jgi:hypothetical protein
MMFWWVDPITDTFNYEPLVQDAANIIEGKIKQSTGQQASDNQK